MVAFWSPRFPASGNGEFRGSVQEASERVLEELRRATSLRMLRSDVPVGSYLSGGLDSSLVAALGLEAKGSQFNTFSLRFADAEYDETEFQREMVRRLGSDHHEIVVRREDIAQVFPEVIAHAEAPILRTAPAPLYLLSKLVRDCGIKVVLTGRGRATRCSRATISSGRERYVDSGHGSRIPNCARACSSACIPYLSRSPVAQQAMAQRFFGRELANWREPGFAHGPRWQSASALHRLFSPALRDELNGFDPVSEVLADLPEAFPQWSALSQDQYLEVRTLLSAYLLSSQGDRMLMAHSVEGRFPFLDREVIALANSLPAEYKLRVAGRKARA